MRPELLIGDGMQDRSEKVHGRKKYKKEPPGKTGGSSYAGIALCSSQDTSNV